MAQQKKKKAILVIGFVFYSFNHALCDDFSDHNAKCLINYINKLNINYEPNPKIL
jgi:hypothetical protein